MCANTTMNRFVEECSTHTAAGEAACVNDPNCKWHQNSADELNTDGSINTSPSETEGLFAHDRIAKFFDHRDDCDRHVITIVTLHEGACDDTKSGGAKTCNTVAPSATCTINGARYTDSPECTKIACAAADKTKCALEIFRWKGQEVHDQTHTGESIFAKGNYEQKFPEWEAGSYSIQYETIDASGLKATGCRNIENVDHTHPIIQILGSDVMTLEATHQGNYIDDGATCSDQVDGVISQNVGVSGDVVNLSKVGTYTITYNCKDSANNAAPAARRTVVVAQTSCPRCHVFGEREINHEASFPYSDAGASCSDVIDGTVTTECYTKHPGESDEQATDCDGQGKSLVDVENTGTYVIQYRAHNSVGLYNDGTGCRGGPMVYQRTVEVMDTLRPVISLKYMNSLVAQGQVGNHNGKTDGSGSGARAVGFGESDAAKATTKDTYDGTDGSYPEFPDYHEKEDGSLKADGHVDYFADSLPHSSLMAEESTSSVNGWVVGAIASAVAGLALLGYSTRRTAVATSVPV